MENVKVKLSSEAVNELFELCISKDAAPTRGVVIVAGLDTTGKGPQILNLLEQLPSNFMADEGGGWSFLNACQDNDGNQWTGMHQIMDKLLVLGIASGHAKILLPREFWHVLPGGVPYFAVIK